MANVADKIHKFEQAGLGQAPFRFTGCSEITYQAYPGAPLQAGGSCDYCSQGIRYAFHIQSSDGNSFKVGSDCVMKTGDAGLQKIVKVEVNKHKREMSHAKDDAIIAEGMALIEQNRDKLEVMAHPKGFEGKTMMDYINWMLQNSGRTGKIKTVNIVKKSLS